MDKLLGCSPDLQLLAQGGATTPVSALADKQVVGLYFSAHWCPPCRGFTPKLAEVYTAIKGTGKSLEIVFVSSDRDDVAFDSYHKEMPWQTLSKRFKVSGIPSLVPCRRRDRPGALQGRPQRHHERPSGHRLSAPKTLDELLARCCSTARAPSSRATKAAPTLTALEVSPCLTSVDGLRVRLGPLLLLWGEPQQHMRETTIRRGDSTTHAHALLLATAGAKCRWERPLASV